MKRLLVLVILFGFLACEKTQVQPEGASSNTGDGDSETGEPGQQAAVAQGAEAAAKADPNSETPQAAGGGSEEDEEFNKEYEEAKSRFTPNMNEAQLLSLGVAGLSAALQSSNLHCNKLLNSIKDMSGGGFILFTEVNYSHSSCS